jgi:capsular exopolysaccharide synthesis family protein
LGWVPDGAEDPVAAGAAIETAFRDRPKGVFAESFRQLRGSLTKRMAPAGHRTIVVCGGMPGSGTSTLVMNLGTAFTAADKRVLLIDANYRRPALHRIAGLQEAPGLADILARQGALEQCAQATSVAGLDVLSAGTREMRVYERLSTEAMSELLTIARSHYDIVLIDAAPAVVAGDALGIASRCDASILVVRAFSEKRGMVARIKNELSDAKAEFLGVVVNGVKSAAGGYLKGNIKAASEYEDA